MQLASFSAHSLYWLLCVLETERYKTQNNMAALDHRQRYGPVDSRQNIGARCCQTAQALADPWYFFYFWYRSCFECQSGNTRDPSTNFASTSQVSLRILRGNCPKFPEFPWSLAMWSGQHLCRLATLNHCTIFFWLWVNLTSHCESFCLRLTVFWFESHICKQFVVSNVNLEAKMHRDK